MTHQTQEGTYTYPYAELSGSVKIGDQDKPYLVLTRLGANKLLTWDGRHVFYLKGSLPQGSGSRESSAPSSSSEEKAR